MIIWKAGDVFTVQGRQTWVGILLFYSGHEQFDVPVLKYVFRTSDTKFFKRPSVGVTYTQGTLVGITKLTTLKKYQRNLLKGALKLAFEARDINNLEYVEALDYIKEIENAETK